MQFELFLSTVMSQISTSSSRLTIFCKNALCAPMNAQVFAFSCLKGYTYSNISLNRSFSFRSQSSKKLYRWYMDLFVQSVSNRSRKLVHQTEGGGYFKHQVIKDDHTKISKPIQPSKLTHQVKLGYS